MGAAWFEAANERPGVPTPAEAAERPEQTIRRQAVEIERLTRRVDELRPMAAHGVRNPPEEFAALRAVADAARAYRLACESYEPTADTWCALLDALDALDGA